LDARQRALGRARELRGDLLAELAELSGDLVQAGAFGLEARDAAAVAALAGAEAADLLAHGAQLADLLAGGAGGRESLKG
jgi:hypothetical protein